MKKFVKILAIVMTLVILFSFAACKRKIKCEMCGETKTTHVHTIKEDGKKYKVY